jgi:predicted transcriptional regulator
MTRITIEVPDEVAERVNAAAAEQGIAPEALAGRAVEQQFPPRRKLSFAAIGSSTSGRGAAEAEELLAEGGFGTDGADR